MFIVITEDIYPPLRCVSDYDCFAKFGKNDIRVYS